MSTLNKDHDDAAAADDDDDDRASGMTGLPTSFLHRHWPIFKQRLKTHLFGQLTTDLVPVLELCLRQDKYCR